MRTKAKNEIHAALMRRLIARPSFSDLFGQRGRAWLRSSCRVERETVDGSLRQLDFCGTEIAQIERVVASEALSSRILRLMTVPGVNVITAATFMAAIGDIRRFRDRRSWSATSGSIRRCASRATRPPAGGSQRRAGLGPPRASRGELERCRWRRARSGPSFERIRARRGHQAAIVAAARKLACLFWHLLTREDDYAYRAASMTRQKLRGSSSATAPLGAA